ncbi:adenosine deaminase 2 [Drosophila novamexicana]|uniref:adenosine deaminase 2 n=1 Tax=Drosophila novamexicana TaxID=47314 RepID=UPI0011E5B153|nr:adenosine deaminase 2 [Drosophila novamexicana]
MSSGLLMRALRHMSGQSARCGKKKYETLSMSRSLRDITPEAYSTLRSVMIQMERASSLGNSMQLTDEESAANKVLMAAKSKELEKGFLNPSKFTPGQHIFQVLKKVERSPLFGLLKTMPKGGILHAHDTALCSTEFLIGLTYRENLWICTADEGCRAIAFRFSESKPTMKAMEECNWEPMADFRERRGEENVKKYLQSRFSMYPFSSFLSNNQAWNQFMSIFILLDGLLLYAPVWAEYYYNALTEMYADGVQYLELRSLLPDLYCLDGAPLKMADTVSIYKSETERFMANNPDFIGARLIYAPLRGVEPKVVDEYVQKCIALKKEFPTFLTGFDLVGQEELGRPLIDFVEPLLKMPEDINFYFHCGETNWFGTSIDENLIDAILLGTKRIGHGYAIVKHPLAIEMVKKLDIAIEVCPVSNQVLQLGQDYRNHPAAMLIANDVPIVIASDDPSFWRATPLTHDFYFAFLGIAPFSADLKLLKHLAVSSIRYSGLTDKEKSTGMEKWQKQWNKWIENLTKAA